MEIWLRKYSGDSSAITMVYVIKVLDSISFQFNSPISPSPLPEEGGDENILVKIQIQQCISHGLCQLIMEEVR